jgi:hypothetical protein
MEVRPYKIPQSVLVVIYREDGQVLLLRRALPRPRESLSGNPSRAAGQPGRGLA